MSDEPQVNPVEAQVAENVGKAIINEAEKLAPADVVKFFDSALGKSVQTLLWTIASFVLAVAIDKVAHLHWGAQIAALGAPGLINWILYSVKVLVDKEVPNLPKN